jgi:tRNA(adenine34) deaminase
VEHSICGGTMDEIYMGEAIKEAKKALKIGEMPIGAVVVFENKIIARGYNKRETKKDSTMHAEIIAIKKACKKTGDWRLNKCSLYVTMEPCVMCLGAVIESRIDKVICGIKNNKYSNTNSSIKNEYKIDVKYGVLEDKIIKMTKNFFNSIRNR